MSTVQLQRDNIEDPYADLVSRARSGDRNALAQLIQETHERVFNLAYRILRNEQEAEDLTQQIFVRMWHALPRFRGDSKFTTWLHMIATNTCLNRRRQLARQLEAEMPQEDLLQSVSSTLGNPSQEVAQQDERAGLWAAVERLPQKYGLVLGLFYQQQLSYAEISKVLELPMGTVKSHLNRARRALRDALERMRIHDAM